MLKIYYYENPFTENEVDAVLYDSVDSMSVVGSIIYIATRCRETPIEIKFLSKDLAQDAADMIRYEIRMPDRLSRLYDGERLREAVYLKIMQKQKMSASELSYHFKIDRLAANLLQFFIDHTSEEKPIPKFDIPAHFLADTYLPILKKNGLIKWKSPEEHNSYNFFDPKTHCFHGFFATEKALQKEKENAE